MDLKTMAMGNSQKTGPITLGSLPLNNRLSAQPDSIGKDILKSALTIESLERGAELRPFWIHPLKIRIAAIDPIKMQPPMHSDIRLV